MFRDKESKSEINETGNTSLPSSRAERLTAMWALSESTLGGILHAVKFPFRGMIISSAAVMLISLIANFSSRKNQIIKSTFVVLITKAVISPHTPLTAYLSVFAQGLLGELLFFTKRFRFISAVLLGLTVSLLNGFQKVLVLTIIYGNTLWNTINEFLNYISEEWLLISLNNPVDFSLLLISIYIGIHLSAGIAAGVIAYRLIISVENKLKHPAELPALIVEAGNKERLKAVKRNKWLKPSAITIFVISAIIILISYLYPESERFDVNAILIMIARSILIIFIWFYLIAPKIKSIIRKYLINKKSGYAKEAESIISTLPMIRLIISSVWKYSASYKGIKRITYFITTSLVYLLYSTE